MEYIVLTAFFVICISTQLFRRKKVDGLNIVLGKIHKEEEGEQYHKELDR